MKAQNSTVGSTNAPTTTATSETLIPPIGDIINKTSNMFKHIADGKINMSSVFDKNPHIMQLRKELAEIHRQRQKDMKRGFISKFLYNIKRFVSSLHFF